MSNAASSDRGMPWWLQPGPAACSGCEADHPLELSVYCIDCDQALCPVCVVVIEAGSDRYCRDCAAQEAA